MSLIQGYRDGSVLSKIHERITFEAFDEDLDFREYFMKLNNESKEIHDRIRDEHGDSQYLLNVYKSPYYTASLFVSSIASLIGRKKRLTKIVRKEMDSYNNRMSKEMQDSQTWEKQALVDSGLVADMSIKELNEEMASDNLTMALFYESPCFECIDIFPKFHELAKKYSGASNFVMFDTSTAINIYTKNIPAFVLTKQNLNICTLALFDASTTYIDDFFAKYLG